MTVGSYEAKTHLPALLERVAKGEEVIITRHGVPIAKLVAIQSPARQRGDVKAAVQALKAFRKGQKLDGLSLRDLIREGRR